MENNGLKKIFFVGVTDKEGTNNRKYSNLVYSVCKTIMITNTDITSSFDISSFLRHDMIPASNLYESIYHCFVTYDAFVVLIDDNSGKYNPNVWFELGIISTLDKPVLLIGKKNTVIPFHANELNVIGFPDEVLGLLKDKDISNYCGRNESIPNLIEHLKKNPLLFKELSTTFLDRMKYLLKHGSPFNYIINGAQIRDFGYSNLTRLFKESGIIRLIQNPDVHAEYIAGEKNAFDELTIEVNNAVESIRTTRFGDQSIVIRRPDEYKEITTAHDNFMNALYKAESRVSKFDRIICNNNPYKWYDITEILKQPSKNVNVYIRKYNYNINFELVVIDERVAFIHFYQTNQSGDYDESLRIGENEARHDSQTQRIKSTLKITGKQTCIELAKIFDRLHHRDSNQVHPVDLSRTLLGVENSNELTEIEKHAGHFTPSQRLTPTNDPQELNMLSDNNRRKFIDALLNWNIKGRDKIIMMIGLHLVYNTALDVEKNLDIEDMKTFNEMLDKYNIDTSMIEKFDLSNLSDNK